MSPLRAFLPSLPPRTRFHLPGGQGCLFSLGVFKGSSVSVVPGEERGAALWCPTGEASLTKSSPRWAPLHLGLARRSGGLAGCLGPRQSGVAGDYPPRNDLGALAQAGLPFPSRPPDSLAAVLRAGLRALSLSTDGHLAGDACLRPVSKLLDLCRSQRGPDSG